jgi:hypothetical protein
LCHEIEDIQGSWISKKNGGSFFFASLNIPMCTTYAMDTCIEPYENKAFGMEVYSYLAHVRVGKKSGMCLIYA